MKKKMLWLALGVFLWQFTFGQEAPPVVLVASSGKVVYMPSAGGKKQKLVNGAVVMRSGAIRLSKGGEAFVFSDGNFRKVEGKNTFPLAAQFPAPETGVGRLSFEQTFGNYLLSAIQLAASPENAADAWGAVRTGTGTGDGWGAIRTGTGTGDGWGSVRTGSGTGDGWGSVRTGSGTGDGWGSVRTGTGTGDGWGGKGNKIRAILPFGKLLPGKATFRWSRPSGNRNFKVSIFDGSNKLVMETTTRDTFWTLDLKAGPLQAGSIYQWSVSSDGEPAAVSNTLNFELADADQRDAVIQRVQRSSSYAQNPPQIQRMMQAVALERGDFYLEAAGLYHELQSADPKNQMLRLMHAAFWIRYGLKELAEEVFRK